jgi:glycosyltransferase involved in cell wall biosynthesis
MKILLCSFVFAPSVGGIETVSAILADEFVKLGSAVTVVTSTPGEPVSAAYEVVRRPSLGQLRKLARNADIVFQSNISLKTLLPLLFCRKPIVVAHHGLIARASGRRGLRDYLKLSLLRRFHNIAVSRSVANALSVKSTIIGDPFEAGEFINAGMAGRAKDIVFLGRLVSDKGCDLVLRALAKLNAEGTCPSFSVIGDGPEMPTLKRLTEELHLSGQVVFRGAIRKGRGKEVAQHKIMVVPSMCAEGFGVVALEGIAAGCAIVASQSGGLPEAVGPCGLLFPNGDVAALASALKELLANPGLQDKLRSEGGRHLEQFQPEFVARRYLKVFEDALQSS